MDDKKEKLESSTEDSYKPYTSKQPLQSTYSTFGSSCKEAIKASFAEVIYSAVANIGRALRWLAKIIAVLVVVKILFIGW